MSLPVEISSQPPHPSKISTTGRLLLALTGGAAVGLSVICASFVSPAFRKFCLPYIPATTRQVDNVFLALRDRKGLLVDLGSGDGRIVLEAAKRGFAAHGVELNFWLVLYSKLDAFRKGQRAGFSCRDLWKFSLRDYDNVVIFGVEQMMQDLETKFREECKEGTNIVACRFPLPNLEPDGTFGNGVDTVWLYIIK